MRMDRQGTRSPNREDVVAAAERVVCAAAISALRGRRVVVTAGPTYEDIDPVRYVGNRSSGRMGFALAAEARAARRERDARCRADDASSRRRRMK